MKHPSLVFDKASCGFREYFRLFANRIATAAGSPWMFTFAVLCVVIWAAVGKHFHYSDTWQLVINTGTTIITFLMVFLIQNTQNRDARAMHLKLDELIRALKGARNNLLNIEELTDDELAQLQAEFKRINTRARNRDERREVRIEEKLHHP